MHRTNRHLNNHLEQDHRGVKQYYQPTCRLKTCTTAARFCLVFDELRAFVHPQLHRKPPLTFVHPRHTHQDQFAQLMGIMVAA
jgi:putative transposase